MGCINIKSIGSKSDSKQEKSIISVESNTDSKQQESFELKSYPNQAKSLDQIFDMKGQIVVGKVVKIYDGDTITCIIHNMGQWIKYKIRLSEIDTCEIKLNTKNMSSDEAVYAEQSIIFSRKAKARLIELVTDGRIQYDVNNNDRTYPNTIDQQLNDMNVFVKIKIEKYESKYGRQLGWIYGAMDPVCTLSFNQILMDDRLAYPYNGGTKLTIRQQLNALNVG